MAKKANPFEFDMSAFQANLVPPKFTEEFTKLAEKFKVSQIDINVVMDGQRKNVEALTAANKTAVEGFQAVARRQGELLGQAVDTASAALEEFTKVDTPQGAAAKQAELAKSAFEKALADTREIIEMSAKANVEASEAINKRISEGLDEIKTLALRYA